MGGVNMNLIECIMKDSRCYKNSYKIKPVGILWHSTGANNPTIKRYVQPDLKDKNYQSLISVIGKNTHKNDWNQGNSLAATHAVIGKLENGTIGTAQCLPWDWRCWGCGKGNNGSGNDYFIQFEIAEDNLSDSIYFHKVYKEAIELSAYLCKLYNWDPLSKIRIKGVTMPLITCHSEAHSYGFASNHSDVMHWFKKYGITMQKVRNDIKEEMEKGEEEMTQEQFNEMMNVYLENLAKQPTSSWAENIMNWAVTEGILAGDQNGNLQAQKFISRQECVALLSRIYNKLK